MLMKIKDHCIEIEDLGNPIEDHNTPFQLLLENKKKEYVSDFRERVRESLNFDNGDTDRHFALLHHVKTYHSPINWFFHVRNYDMLWGLSEDEKDAQVRDNDNAKIFIHDFNKFCHDYERLERLYDLNKFYWIDQPNQLLDIWQLGCAGLKRQEKQK